MYAQTNIQLYNQMRARGYTTADLAAVAKAYDFATKIFTAKFRASGKPLLAHLVGTASVLCALDAPATLLAAAVLHAAYIFGEFGDGREGVTPAKRAALREAVGEEIEDVVARYQALEWREGTAAAMNARADALSPSDVQVLLVRLANELEDHLDLGVLYCGNAQRRRQAIESSLHLCVDLAVKVNQPFLAKELGRAFEEVMSSDVPELLRHPRDYTYLLPPRSHMPKPGTSVRRVVDRHPKLRLLLHPVKLLVVLAGLAG